MEAKKETYDFNDNSQSNYQMYLEEKARDFDLCIMRSLGSILNRSVGNLQVAHRIREQRQKAQAELGVRVNSFVNRLVMRDVIRSLYD
mmetsp:Transcript_26273/g.46985  ORF Transcript_26273/g.46985 Transcript_26273/m.46985 type:complete len:88 (-) Transcript_26273:3763-4026(-)